MVIRAVQSAVGTKVSILVLVDVPLEFLFSILSSTERRVSILVLVDVPLEWHEFSAIWVKIRVIMAYFLRSKFLLQNYRLVYKDKKIIYRCCYNSNQCTYSYIWTCPDKSLCQ